MTSERSPLTGNISTPWGTIRSSVLPSWTRSLDSPRCPTGGISSRPSGTITASPSISSRSSSRRPIRRQGKRNSHETSPSEIPELAGNQPLGKKSRPNGLLQPAERQFSGMTRTRQKAEREKGNPRRSKFPGTTEKLSFRKSPDASTRLMRVGGRPSLW